jgi:alpha-amylase
MLPLSPPLPGSHPPQNSYGQVLKVVGALEELGAWEPSRAPAMTWREGHAWSLDVELPAGSVSFKVVMEDAAGGVRW